jgi:hypothetical protein
MAEDVEICVGSAPEFKTETTDAPVIIDVRYEPEEVEGE